MTGKRVIHSLTLRNLLSFGPDSQPIELGPLNVLIGPNGSGKSNFLTALSILRAAPRDLSAPFVEGTSAEEWAWKGPAPRNASSQIGADVMVPLIPVLINYSFSCRFFGNQLRDLAEGISRADNQPLSKERRSKPPLVEASYYYRNAMGKAVIFTRGRWNEIPRDELDPQQSILSQRKDPDQFEELTRLGRLFSDIGLYRSWTLGPRSLVRRAQPADMKGLVLEEDAGNLGLVLNRIKKDTRQKRKLVECFRLLYEGLKDVEALTEAGRVRVFVEEEGLGSSIPASRLSDGTLRWLELLAILLDPEPGPVVCIEEPELGLHPDVIPKIAELLVDASQRMQLIVTTHSEILVDALSGTPEAVLVCEKEKGSTRVRRLSREQLGEWLKKYTLGQLWSKGELGGNRW